MRVDDKGVDIGGDPEMSSEWFEDAFENLNRNPNTPQSLTQLVSSPVWLSTVDLFTMRHDGSGAREGTHHTLYYAQSWMVVHYLINKNRLPETGVYLDLVLNQKVPVDKAIVQAFDLTPATFEEAVKTYFHSLSGLAIAMDRSKQPLEQADVVAQAKQVRERRRRVSGHRLATIPLLSRSPASTRYRCAIAGHRTAGASRAALA